MKNYVLESLKTMRGETSPAFSEELLLRHAVTIHERNTTAAYYFSAPIRAVSGSKPVEMKWVRMPDGVFVYRGTGCSIYVRADSILFRSPSDTVRVGLHSMQHWYPIGADLCGGDIKLTCTLNGVVVHKKNRAGERFTFTVTPAHLGYEPRSNSKYFAVMKHKFQPVFTASSLCYQTADHVASPLILENVFDAQLKKYRLTIRSTENADGEMSFEMNMYESKIIQDTTVESAHPDENNAFGSTAFVGNSELFGEQQLYIKFDYPRFTEMKNKHLVGIRLWLPILCGSTPLEAYEMDTRFCSFGSTWNKRIPPSSRKLPLTQRREFCCVDLSEIMIDQNGRLLFSNGLLLRAVSGFAGYCALATGDNYDTPVVLECKYLS